MEEGESLYGIEEASWKVVFNGKGRGMPASRVYK
jgi:hypothetical protein